ncbi:metallophosphoesterase [Paenibacillus aurantiacus]|uniref:Metallophosphoesterase n=1 Tax=Paenibacillus aurantiacus TaxID=1936118 RepID=A0ABV5KZE8_9BACL
MLSIVKGPYLQWPTPHTVTVMWETSEPADSKVMVWQAERIHSGYLGNYKQPEQVVQTVHLKESTVIHRITLEGLAPSTVYHYQVHSSHEHDNVASGKFFLKTAVQRGTPFSLAVTSETGGYSGFDTSEGQINRNVFHHMRRYRPDFALFVGDIVNDGHNVEDWERYFFLPGKELLSDTPFYCCLGNHENHSPWFHRFFAYPPPSRFYAFDYGDARFICLDSTELIDNDTYPLDSGKMAPGHEQFDFLVRALEESDARWKIVFFHYPPYVSGGYQVEALRALSPVLEQHGVDLVLNSHTIAYERSHPIRDGGIDYENGIVYVVAGGAGAMPSWLLPKREWHTAQSLAVPHFLHVVITPHTLELQAIDDEGRLFDRFGFYKDVSGKRYF